LKTATKAFLDTLNEDVGLMGCNMLKLFMEGNAKSTKGYYIGWRDEVVAKSTYLLTLAQIGTLMEASYYTLEVQDPYAYVMIAQENGPKLKNAVSHIKKYSDDCMQNWYTYAKENARRIYDQRNGVSN